MEHSPCLQASSRSSNTHLFMEPDCQLPCSQELATGTYPEPYEFGPHPLITRLLAPL
jgi:hypothetical protein